MINIFKMKLPEKYTNAVKKHKDSTPEEKRKMEDDFIKAIKDKDSQFYSPMLASMDEQKIRQMIKVIPNLIDTGDDTDD
ncbi:DUF7366 family protein [Staphylococcus pasteuri]|uniref:DUF7366 family protein n=1 Tax=Staphylococcus pasteuri TaxID=45972 RepID=UPI002DB92DCE|nr:hypothetical protein [Staphylococcus pasteuri]MEB7433326.1 hypothetical protein [Staphylococcus pasteuri]